MAAHLNPYISFKDSARAAMEFYREVFGGELQINTFGQYGDPDAPGADLIMHSLLATQSGFALMGNDAPPGTDCRAGGNISVSLSGRSSTDGDELRGYWAKLSADGTVITPFGKQVWGDEFGLCTDKFGVNWMVNVTAD
jgi:PhnB protein